MAHYFISFTNSDGISIPWVYRFPCTFKFQKICVYSTLRGSQMPNDTIIHANGLIFIVTIVKILYKKTSQMELNLQQFPPSIQYETIPPMC